MVQTVRNQIKAYQIQVDPNAEITIKVHGPLRTWLPRHEAGQHTRFHKRQDSTTTAHEKIRHTSFRNPILSINEAVCCRCAADYQEHPSTSWNFLGSKVSGLGVTVKLTIILSSHRGMVRSRALKRRAESRRWDPALLSDGVGCVETDTGQMRKVAEGPQRPGGDPQRTSSESSFQSARACQHKNANNSESGNSFTAHHRVFFVRTAETEAEEAPPTQKNANNDIRFYIRVHIFHCKLGLSTDDNIKNNQ